MLLQEAKKTTDSINNMSSSCEKIGFIDSGIGGLTVLENFMSIPNTEIFYFADLKYMPYGNKSFKEIEFFCDQIITFFLSKEIFQVVVACNTAAFVISKNLKNKFFKIKFIMAIDQTSLEALRATENKKIGVMATSLVIKNNVYLEAIKSIDSSVQVFQESCFDLAQLIEGSCQKALDKAVEKHINRLKKHQIDTLILACTHYGFIKENIKKHASHFKVISSDNHRKQFNQKSEISSEKQRLNLYISLEKEKLSEKTIALFRKFFQEKINYIDI